MRIGDCTVNVYRACSTTAATPIPPAKRRSSPKRLARIRCDFDRLLRTRFGAVAVGDIAWHLWVVGTAEQRCFLKTVTLIAKENDVAEVFFDQMTTAPWNVLERIGKEAAHAMTQAESLGDRPAPPQFVQATHEITQVLQTPDAIPVSLKLDLAS